MLQFIVAGPWDLELPTNVIMYERTPGMWPHPHPDTEVLRFQFIMKLRQTFQEMCHSREGKLELGRTVKKRNDLTLFYVKFVYI